MAQIAGFTHLPGQLIPDFREGIKFFTVIGLEKIDHDKTDHQRIRILAADLNGFGRIGLPFQIIDTLVKSNKKI